MSDLPIDSPQPRLCHIYKWPDCDSYGFNLHTHHDKSNSDNHQFIGEVDPGSPADVAELQQGDRILEVNGINISNENHKQGSYMGDSDLVVARIKSNPNETRLLVIDKQGDMWYQERGLQITNTQQNVRFCSSNQIKPTNGHIAGSASNGSVPSSPGPEVSSLDPSEGSVDVVAQEDRKTEYEGTKDEILDDLVQQYDNIAFRTQEDSSVREVSSVGDESLDAPNLDTVESRDHASDLPDPPEYSSTHGSEEIVTVTLEKDDKTAVSLDDQVNGSGHADDFHSENVPVSEESLSKQADENIQPDSCSNKSSEFNDEPKKERESVSLSSSTSDSDAVKTDDKNCESDAVVSATSLESKETTKSSSSDISEPKAKREVLASPQSKPNATSAKGPSKIGGLNLDMTAAEMRAHLASKKKPDPRLDSIDWRKKYEIVKNL